MWSSDVKWDRFAIPSLMDIVKGLTMYLDKKLEFSLREIKSQVEIDVIKQQYKEVFMKLISLSGIKDADVSLKGKLDNLNDPSVCLIMYLYSCEPPLYMDLHLACRRKDNRYLESLGPMARAIMKIFENAETKRIDKAWTGYYDHDPAMGRKHLHPMGYFSRSFMLMKCAFIDP